MNHMITLKDPSDDEWRVHTVKYPETVEQADMSYQIQSKLDGQWDTASVGDSVSSRFGSFAAAQSAVIELIDTFGQIVDADGTDHSPTGVTLAVDSDGCVHEYRVVEV